MKAKYDKRLFERKAGVRLDVGCGLSKQKGYIGLDIEPHPNVDIVHDVQVFPWPVPDSSCFQILMSHLWEHIEPKYRFRVMDELWRIIRHDGQLLIAAPYADSFLAFAHPAHYTCPNEAAFQFFDPDYRLWHCEAKKALPWKIIRNDPNVTGCIEVVMEPRKTKDGKPIICPVNPAVPDCVRIESRKQNGE